MLKHNLIIIACVGLLLAACGAKPSRLVGTWEGSGPSTMFGSAKIKIMFGEDSMDMVIAASVLGISEQTMIAGKYTVKSKDGDKWVLETWDAEDTAAKNREPVDVVFISDNMIDLTMRDENPKKSLKIKLMRQTASEQK